MKLDFCASCGGTENLRQCALVWDDDPELAVTLCRDCDSVHLYRNSLNTMASCEILVEYLSRLEDEMGISRTYVRRWPRRPEEPAMNVSASTDNKIAN